MITAKELLEFEEDIAAEFAAGNIKAPVHLAGGNEEQLIKIFQEVKPRDWVLCSWRSHYHCLLKGVPPEQVKAAIMRGRSIALCFPEYRVLSSAIVGGICPIAVGIAWGIKHPVVPTKSPSDESVWCFIGDMTCETGIYRESARYASGHELPVRWVVEDNGLSVCTKTRQAWGYGVREIHKSYNYTMTRLHVGIGKWVKF